MRNGRRKLLIVVPLAVLIYLVLLLTSEHDIDSRYRILESKRENVFSFRNVCLEPLLTPLKVNFHQINFTVTQRIVIYEEPHTPSGEYRLKIAGPPNHPWNYYDVYFRKGSRMPEGGILSDSTAFFVSPRCPGNLHHFFQEEYLPLYSVVRLTGNLYPGANNVVVYNTPKTNHNSFCRNFSTYDEIVRTLHTDGFQNVYYNLQSNTCFRTAVFGSLIRLNNTRDPINHIISAYNLTEWCSLSPGYATIVSRKNRRIVNIEDLRHWLIAAGFRQGRLRTVDFDGLPIRKQIGIACSSRLMIGVNGAALQWSTFMPEQSHLVEVSWPSKYWPFFYASLVPTYGILYHSVEATDVRVNWTTYEHRVQNRKRIDEREREQILEADPEDLWKWADVYLHQKEMTAILTMLYDRLHSVKMIR